MAWRDELSRPWDGIDGADFETFKANCERSVHRNGDIELTTPYMRWMEKRKQTRDKERAEAAAMMTATEKVFHGAKYVTHTLSSLLFRRGDSLNDAPCTQPQQESVEDDQGSRVDRVLDCFD